MGFWDNIIKFGKAAAAGDSEGAGQAAGDASEDAGRAAVDGANAAGDAASDVTGGAVDLDVNDDGVSGRAYGASGRVDTDDRDGSVGVGAEFDNGSGATTFVGATADTDTSDGTAGVAAEAGVRSMGHELAAGADFGNSDQPEGQFGLDVGARLDSHGVGATANIDSDEEQAGVDLGGYYENEEARAEGGLTVNADQSYGQVGLDAGAYGEFFDDDGKQTARQEGGATVNLDAAEGNTAFRGGVDAGLFIEVDAPGSGAEVRAETGAAISISADTGRGGIAVGGYGEITDDAAREEIRAEGGFGAGIVELSEDNTDAGFGAGVGVHGAVTVDRDGMYESADTDSYVGVSVDDDGVVLGVVAGQDSTADDGRDTAQAGLRLGADDGRGYVGVVADNATDDDYEAGVWVGSDGAGNNTVGMYGRSENGEDLDFGLTEEEPFRINLSAEESGSDESASESETAAPMAAEAEAQHLAPELIHMSDELPDIGVGDPLTGAPAELTAELDVSEPAGTEVSFEMQFLTLDPLPAEPMEGFFE